MQLRQNIFQKCKKMLRKKLVLCHPLNSLLKGEEKVSFTVVNEAIYNMMGVIELLLPYHK